MKGLKFCALLMAGAFVSVNAFAVAPPTCPPGGSATLGCNSTIIVNADNTLTIANGPSAATPYDGSDDNLVGILNNTGHSLGNIHLTGTGNGGGLFAFDLDGIDVYITGPGTSNATDTTGYGGPLSYFSNITTTTQFADTGDVNFIGGLANGASTYFSLESSIATSTITGGGGGGGGSVTPEPSTFVLLGTGALGVAGTLRRRFMKR